MYVRMHACMCHTRKCYIYVCMYHKCAWSMYTCAYVCMHICVTDVNVIFTFACITHVHDLRIYVRIVCMYVSHFCMEHLRLHTSKPVGPRTNRTVTIDVAASTSTTVRCSIKKILQSILIPPPTPRLNPRRNQFKTETRDDLKCYLG